MPATRRSSGFGGNNIGPSNLDHILEHFNQFKRKHITQNRDIIKTNALAQLRIKELEDKVLALEAERTERELDLYRSRQKLAKTAAATAAVQQGWQLISAGLSRLGVQSHHNGQSEMLHLYEQAAHAEGGSSSLASARLAADTNVLRDLFGKSNDHLKPSKRVQIDPNALPAGVARGIARPPEAEMQDIAEEENAEYDEGEDQDDTVDVVGEASLTARGESDYRENGSNQVSFALDGDEGISIGNASQALDGDETQTPNDSTDDSQLLNVPPASGARRRISAGPGPSKLGVEHSLKTMKSVDSLSSCGDEDLVQLSDDECEDVSPSSTTQSSTTRETQSDTSTDHRGVGKDQASAETSPARRSGRRSSKFASPGSDHTPSSPEQSVTSYTRSESESPSGPRNAARRSSMRDRKSINYALPKLNTKMRKPDPVDLVPAKRDTRRSVSMPLRAKKDGDEESLEGSSHADGAQESGTSGKNIRLRKGNGVASTGNLREIRKLHEQQTDHESAGSTPALIKDLALHADELGTNYGNDDAAAGHGEGAGVDDGTQAETSGLPAADSSENVFQSGRSTSNDASIAGREFENGISGLKPVASNIKPQLSNPFDLSFDPFLRDAPFSGTPIQKAGNRYGNGGHAGNIRAFKVAGRNQKAPVTSRPAFTPAPSKDNPSQHSSRILVGSSRANTASPLGAQSISRPGSATSGTGLLSTTDKHASPPSLHAAMTSASTAPISSYHDTQAAAGIHRQPGNHAQ